MRGHRDNVQMKNVQMCKLRVVNKKIKKVLGEPVTESEAELRTMTS